MAADPVREEAERLVAAAIAAVSLASRSLPGGGRRGAGLATGSAECCVCPVCRAIAAMRDPSSEAAERLATGAGDLATGVASLLRALSRPSASRARDDGVRDDDGARDDDRDETTREGDEFWESLRRRAGRARASETDPWHEATTAEAPPLKPMAKKAVAKKAVAKKAMKKKAPRKATGAGENA